MKNFRECTKMLENSRKMLENAGKRQKMLESVRQFY